ncbi:hypothetical protein ACFLYS_00305 [Chloroflexota bacterium]
MSKEPEWTKEEFLVLVSKPDVSDEELANLLPNRSIGAVEVVRAGVHSFHTGGDISMLSRMMNDLLGSKVTIVECPICKTAF